MKKTLGANDICVLCVLSEVDATIGWLSTDLQVFGKMVCRMVVAVSDEYRHVFYVGSLPDNGKLALTLSDQRQISVCAQCK